MNFSVVVEGGIGTKRIYRNWIPLVNQHITYVDRVSDITSDNFAITAGHGYPDYYDIIDCAIADVNHFGNIDRLVIAIDSEDLSFEEKHEEITNLLAGKHCSSPVFIVIQHFCLETWALGNRRACRVNPSTARLAKYKGVFDVRQRDPELLPPYPEESLNRAQFAERYLRAMLNEWQPNLGYQKRNPRALLAKTYFNEVKRRFATIGHICSFRTFLNAFT